MSRMINRPNAGQNLRLGALPLGIGKAAAMGSAFLAASFLGLALCPGVVLSSGFSTGLGSLAGLRRSMTLPLRFEEIATGGRLAAGDVEDARLATASMLRELRIGLDVSFGSIVSLL